MNVVQSIPLSVTLNVYECKSDDKIFHLTLRNKNMSVELTNIGCAITTIRTADKRNEYANIVGGFTDLCQYQVNKDYLGCIVGRFTNRIANGKFQLNGMTCRLSVNDGRNHLHGGTIGFSRRLWKIDKIIENKDECGVVFKYLSPDGEEGYPGNLSVTVKYSLDNKSRLCISYRATTDRSTPVSLTNHSYFNLSGFKEPSILGHHLCINADKYTVKSCDNTPSSEIAEVGGTPLDFRTPKLIGKDIDAFPEDLGLDHNFIIKTHNDKIMRKAAVLSEEGGGRIVTIYTDCPAIQAYTSNFWDGTIRGEQGFLYQKHGAVALETQAFPDSPNHSHFPDTILHPGETYESCTIYEFGVETE